MAEIVGPNLDELNNWSSTVDGLPFNLDNSIWLTAALREAVCPASIAMTTTANAVGPTNAQLAATISMAVSASAIVTFDCMAMMSVSMTSSVSANRIREVSGSADIALTTSSPSYDVINDRSASCDIRVWPNGDLTGTFLISGNETVAMTTSATSEELGETWTLVSTGNEVWSEAA